MDPRYWEGVGDDYASEIFDSARMDSRGVVRARLREYADDRASACDFGCGIGHYLPLLSPLFRRVYGFDFAASLLKQAEARCESLPNASVARANLASSRARLPVPKLRFGVCANVLISDDARMRRNILRTIHRHVADGAHVLFVVPSLESSLWANTRCVEWNQRLGFSGDEALELGAKPSARTARELLRGLVRIEGVPTKHYLREEFEVWLEQHGFRTVSSDKIEYSWATEFERPPAWMTGPGPWDWLFVARKRRR